MLSILICITLFYHTGLLFDELASNTDNSYVTMTLGSSSWFNANKVNKKENSDEKKEE